MVFAPVQAARPTQAEMTLMERGLPTDRHVQDAIAEAMRRWLWPMLDAMGQAIISRLRFDIARGDIRPPVAAVKQAVYEDDPFWDGLAMQWQGPLREWAVEAFADVGRYQAQRWFFYADMRRINQAALDWTVNDYIPSLIRLTGSESVIRTTREGVAELVALWERGELPGGRGLPDLMQALELYFTPQRARRIAVTEATRVYAEANRTAWLNSYADEEMTQAKGIVAMRWNTARDERVCPICEPLNGKVVLVNGGFPVEGGIPPAHPGCRCGLSPLRSYNPAFHPPAVPSGPKGAMRRVAKPTKRDVEELRRRQQVGEV
jgi:SPP1 gp7 family putative phage head morphogenesis protein